MKVIVKRIPVDGETLQGIEPPSIMDLHETDVTFDSDIEYDLYAQIQGSALLVTGKLRAPAKFICSRCLQKFPETVRVNAFVFHRELKGEDFVDLTENLREDIILELPQRALCQQNCKGLCPVCGKDLNEGVCRCKPAKGDLRWHALDQIKLK